MTVTTYSDSVAAEVRAEMGRQRLSQRQLAARLGWDPRMLSRRLNGEVAFSTSDLDAISDALSIPLSTLTSPRARAS